jgi:hypothetical protein
MTTQQPLYRIAYVDGKHGAPMTWEDFVRVITSVMPPRSGEVERVCLAPRATGDER